MQQLTLLWAGCTACVACGWIKRAATAISHLTNNAQTLAKQKKRKSIGHSPGRAHTSYQGWVLTPASQFWIGPRPFAACQLYINIPCIRCCSFPLFPKQTWCWSGSHVAFLRHFTSWMSKNTTIQPDRWLMCFHRQQCDVITTPDSSWNIDLLVNFVWKGLKASKWVERQDGACIFLCWSTTISTTFSLNNSCTFQLPHRKSSS